MTTDPVSAADVEDLRVRLAELMPQVRRDLERLVRIRGVSASAFAQQPVEDSAEAVAELLRGADLPEVEILRVRHADGRLGAPAVVGRRPAPPGAPTVLLYGHHDVQPPGDEAEWLSPPFEPTERSGRLYGRGVADDKAGVMAHVAALRALADRLAVGVTVFVEGEEEIGSPTFAALLGEHRERLAADVIVVADSMNWAVGTPALTSSLRGLVDGTITVRTLDHGVHSGMFGGAAPDALTAAIRLLDTLWDADGSVAVAGLVASRAADVPYSQEAFRADAGLLDGVRAIGSGSLPSRLWTRPALTIVGMDVPPVATAANTLLPSVRAKFSLRLAPGQDPAAAFTALAAHLRERAPWGARVEVRQGEAGRGFAADTDSPAHQVARWALERAWGSAPVEIGVGGSIPFVADLVRAYPAATVLVTGVEDPDSRAHGPNESLHLGEFARACLAETLLLAGLAG
jgi:acetylornithine deacetylase/succinyl-diaminopimelate desuccinylase-like protein